MIRPVKQLFCLFLLCLLSLNLALAGNNKEVVVLDRNLDALIDDFNEADEQVRLIFIVGPTCDVCKKGLKEMKEVVLDRAPPDMALSIFVVHVPALEAQQGDIQTTFSLFNDDRAIHYWDEHGTSGIRFQRTLELPSYAWDVWMIYPPKNKWMAKDAPKPSRWWHQLPGIDPTHRLNATEFSEVLNNALTLTATGSAED